MGRERKFPSHALYSEIAMQDQYWGIILAAGQGRRMAEVSKGVAKQFLLYKDRPLWWHSARAMALSPLIRGLVLVFPEETLEQAKADALALNRKESLGVP